ncbi:MAG: hypothetical protein M1821_004747 [Bathelium mastoideum]|nr:MAG: hypothetical protein M1821_004747 [Bathelium mastoideum]KAI9692156.1 MAG: hypothetical protein M1822_006386 [Bathelium mastoideum]
MNLTDLVFDLPQLYNKPSSSSLLDTISLLTIDAPSWNTITDLTPPRSASSSPIPSPVPRRRKVDPYGIPHYLLTILTSSLVWLPEADRTTIHTATSHCIASRAGRAARPSFTRTFRIPLFKPERPHPANTSQPQSKRKPKRDEKAISISIHEPALTGAHSLGLKTWASAPLLARLLCGGCPTVSALLPRRTTVTNVIPTSTKTSAIAAGAAAQQQQRYGVLELGSGTGLVGLALAASGTASGLGLGGVVVTDLSAIADVNLAANVAANADVVAARGAPPMAVAVLDWDAPDEADLPAERFPLIVAADCVYDRDHPWLLARVVGRWLERSADAVVVVESPIREGFAGEIAELKKEMSEQGLEVRAEGWEQGVEDWGEELNEVECRWVVWGVPGKLDRRH